MQPFKLDAVLQYREQLEDQARQQLFTTLEKETQALQNLAQQQETLEALYTLRQDSLDKGTTVLEIVLLENRIPVVQQQVQEAQNALQTIRKKVEKTRRQLELATQNKKILGKMKGRQNLSYKQYLDKKEQAMLDELAVLYHNREAP